MKRPTTKRLLNGYKVFKPHTIVFHRPNRAFYEVIGYGKSDYYHMSKINDKDGEILAYGCYVDSYDVEVIAPTHPVYILWAARRLQDRLEGLDRA